MFDKKIEPIAQKYIRAIITLEEAQELVDLAKEQVMAVIPEGEKYVTKDGDTITHAKSSTRRKFLPEVLSKLLTPKVWKAVRIDAIDTKKLTAYIDAGEVDVAKIAEGIEITPVRSSLRMTWGTCRPATKTKVA